MINLTKVRPDGVIGSMARFPLRLIPKATVVRIIQGPLRGKKWIVGAGIHRYWLGSYEFEKQKAFAKFVKPGSVVLDIGANVGFYTLLASTLAGPAGRVFCFEPLPANLDFLRKHISLNSIANVTVSENALSDKIGFTTFEESYSRSTGKISKDGRLAVKTSTLDSMFESGQIPPSALIKVDVEGAEFDVLRGGQTYLSETRPVLFVATHNPEVHKLCCDFLETLGFRISALDGSDLQNTDEILAEPK